MTLIRMVWVHLSLYLKTGMFAEPDRIRAAYKSLESILPNAAMSEASLQRMNEFSLGVAKEYVQAYPSAELLETAVVCLAASLGFGSPTSAQEHAGELIYSEMEAAVTRNGLLRIEHEAPADVHATGGRR